VLALLLSILPMAAEMQDSFATPESKNIKYVGWSPTFQAELEEFRLKNMKNCLPFLKLACLHRK